MSKILTDSYTGILKMAALAVTEDGCVSIVDEKKNKPLTIKGKRLVIPIQEQLTNSNWEHRVVFHPGHENFHRGESVVMERYRNLLMLNFNQIIAANIHRFLDMGTDLDIQATMTPDQQEYLVWVKDATKETIPRFVKILASISQTDLTKTFVKVFLKRGALLEGRDFGRAGIVSFPFYELLVAEKAKKGQKKIHNVVVNADDLTTLIHLMEYMFPGIAVADKYSRGTNVQTNPVFDSVMRVALALAEPLNSLCDLFGPLLGDDVRIDVSWSPVVMDNVAFYKEVLRVPMQAGNEGGAVVSSNDPNPAAPLTHPAAQAVVNQNPHALPHQQQVAVDPMAGYAALTGRAPAAAVVPAPVPQYVPPVPMQPAPLQPAPVQYVQTPIPQQQLYNQFGQPVNVQQSNANVRNPDGSTNFAALIASDPALANAAGVNQNAQFFNNNRAAPNSRATLSSPVAQVNTGWGNNNGGNWNNNGWNQPQQNNGWGQPQQNNGWGGNGGGLAGRI